MSNTLSLPKLEAYLAGTPLEALREAEEREPRTADKLEIGDAVVISGNVNFKEQTGEITRFGKNKHFVVVKLHGGGEHSFHSSDVSETDTYKDDDEHAESHDKFYVAFYDTAEERSWIGVISKEHGGKWHEKSFKGKPELRWGQTYMSYLTPDDIMSWIHKDYHRGIEIEGPFFDSHEAEEHVKHNWGRIEESKKALTPWAVLNSIAKDHGETGFCTMDSDDVKRYVNVKKADKIAEDEEGEFGLMTCDEAAIKRIINKNPDLLIGDAKKMLNAKSLDEGTFTKRTAIVEGKSTEDQEKAIKQLEKLLASMRKKKLSATYQPQQEKDILAGEKELKKLKAALEKAKKIEEGKKKGRSMLDALDDMDKSLDDFSDVGHGKSKKPRGKLKKTNEEVFTNYADWKQSVLLSNPAQAKNIKFRGKMEGEKITVSAFVPGEDKVFGIWDDAVETGTVLSEKV